MKIIIIGSVAAGTSAAAKARRNMEDAEIVLYDQGKDISFSVCGIPYYLGEEVEQLDNLTPRDSTWFKERYRIDVFTEHRVLKIDKESKVIEVINLVTGQTFHNSFDTLVLATGASPVIPAPFSHVQASNVFNVRNIENARDIDAFTKSYKPLKALIIGAGFIGLEMAEQWTRKGYKVTILQRSNQVMTGLDEDVAFYLEKKLEEKGIRLILEDEVVKTVGTSIIEEIHTKKGLTLQVDIICIAAGIRPNIELAKQVGATIGQTGAVSVSQSMETSVPSIYAIGDVAESFSRITGKPIYRPLGTTANKMGRMAGDVITGGRLEHKGIVGTSILRLFDLHVGQTGLTEREARAEGLDITVLHNIKPAYATYMGGKEIIIKAIADIHTRRLLGAQVIGYAGVDKRIDAFAISLVFEATVDDLFHYDLAYAPSFATTKDPVMYTGMALANALGAHPLITPKELIQKINNGEQIQVIDTRSASNYHASHVKNARHIPLTDLRKRVKELDPSLPTVTYCNKGVTGNAAQNLLLNKGFKEVYNLSGGNKNYKHYLEMIHKKNTYLTFK